MKKNVLFFLFLAMVILISQCRAYGFVSDGPESSTAGMMADHVRGELVLDLKDEVPESAINAMMKEYGVILHYNSPWSKKYRILIADTEEKNLPTLICRLRKDRRVEFAEPNYVFNALNYPNDPLYKYQWHMEKIKVRSAWKYATGQNVIVAVIDTGVAYEDYKNFHRIEDLEHTPFVSPYNFVERTIHANDDHCHGSHVAGTIAQSTNNNKGVAGIAYNCKIMPLKVLSSAGSGRMSDIADAIRYAADNGARVINMSLGGRMGSSTLESACKYAYNKGVTIVCAAGNDGSERISYPAAYPECIAVSATRDDDQITWYSNKGPNIDIAAPGGDTRVDQNGDGYMDGVLQNTIKVRTPEQEDYALFQGTSMASPHVAGVAALLVSLGYNNPAVVKGVLQKSARKKGLGDLKRGYGAGILDAEKAVTMAGFLDGLVKLILGLFITLLLLYSLRGIPGSSYTLISPLYLTGIIIGSCGLFFLPNMGIDVPLKNILLRGFPQWDIAILGAAFHGNVLFYSALFPFALCFLTFSNSVLKKFALGFSAGVASHLIFYMILRPAEIQFIPGFLFLDRIWLLLNALLCIYFSYLLIRLLPDRTVPAEPEEILQGEH
jgi:serine protease